MLSWLRWQGNGFFRSRIGIVNRAGGFVFVGFGVLLALCSKK